MDSDYDRKFEELKSYIPFLEKMIKSLSSSNLPSNPRQAQLDKMRSLRDLLLNTKKRMKMENLLKCEQVLINLYKKVELRESISDTKSDSEPQSAKGVNLEEVRNKLKSVVSKINEDTLPEIARASDRTTEDAWDPGSKEPALFQRRPIPPSPPIISKSPTKQDTLLKTETSSQICKKSYTRVLVSPDRSDRKWSESEGPKTEKALFSRRSPRRQQRDVSPSYHKKERKKDKKKSKNRQSNDLNITLKVPEESLSSLSTDDILSRIINCNDNDVDIDTLRELRSQILGELKHTGANEDISDILLKSYAKNKNETEVEEGEISDSESETIESVYGNLVVMDKDKNQSTIKASLGKDKSRKIQICLVINSDKIAPSTKPDDKPKSGNVDESDFESFSIDKKRDTDDIMSEPNPPQDKGELNTEPIKTLTENDSVSAEKNIEEQTKNKIAIDEEKNKGKSTPCDVKKDCPLETTNRGEDQNIDSKKVVEEIKSHDEVTKSKSSEIVNESCVSIETKSETVVNNPSKPVTEECSQKTTNVENAQNCFKKQDSVEIPFINLEETAKQETVSEIEILQALKKEILGETPVALDTQAETPLLHQPKLTKVASAQEIVKKRISIENYKQKANLSPKPLFFKNDKKAANKEDKNKKQSLRLTEKECERFKLPIQLPLDESSDDEYLEELSPTLEQNFNDSAPKSPDHEDFADTGIKPPVIIPSDPVKPNEAILVSTADIDMRNVMNTGVNSIFTTNALSAENQKNSNADLKMDNDKPRVPLQDPRKIRREDSLSQDTCMSTENLPSQNLSKMLHNQVQSMGNASMSSNNLPLGPNMTPLRVPNTTPVYKPNMTPNARSFEMTPSRHPYESDDYQGKKHVYAPMFPTQNFDTFDTQAEYNQWDTNMDNNRSWERNKRNSLPPRDVDYRRNNRDSYQNDLRHEIDERESYNRMDCPPTPVHPFGRQDCPATPLPSFGRFECPTTPLPSFGRLECPSTPLPSFGRLDCPATPLPSFGRLEMPMTPVHPFGRSDGSATPVHSFGRSDYGQNYNAHNNSKYGRNSDPRLNRQSENDNYNRWEEDRDSRYYRDRQFNSGYTPDQRSYYPSEKYRSFESNTNKDDMYNRSRKNRNDRQYNDYRYDRDYKGRSQIKDNEKSRNFRDRGRIDMDSDNYKYSGYRKNNNEREKSVTRDKSVEKQFSNSYQASSTSRKTNKDQFKEDVQQSPGLSFNIDTSVSSSFQEFDNVQLNFNSRKQRATSVGRTFSKESRNQNKTKSNNKEFECFNRQRSFSRARSVGREEHSTSCMNFKDVKADLRSYKFQNQINSPKKKKTEVNKSDKNMVIRNIERQSSQNTYNDKYSPRKNLRDPRMRRESRWGSIDKNDKSRARDSRGFGIVYSDDNISKGTVLGSGSGVKNYKIPKIKRSPEKSVPNEEIKDKEQNEDIDKDVKRNISRDTKDKSDSDKNKIIKDVSYKISKESSQDLAREVEKQSAVIETESCIIVSSPNKLTSKATDENRLEFSEQEDDAKISNRRVTRSAKMSLSVEPLLDSPSRRRRKCKKSVIYDSESDTEEKNIAKSVVENSEKDTIPFKIDVKTDNSFTDTKTKVQDERNSCEDLNSSFGDIFSDNISCDPVLDNINALIADLDHDLDTSKNVTQNQFTQEISLENMLENITTSPTELDKTPLADVFSNQELSDQQGNDLLIANDTPAKNALENRNSSCSLTEELKKDEECSAASVCTSNKTMESDTDKSEAVVSTSIDITQESEKSLEQQTTNESNDASKLTAPDSTINITNSKESSAQESVPDSTNESSNDITSSISDVCGKELLKSSEDSTDHSDSIGKLLSILQDKSKIKELLTILEKNSSDNDKIKKKLEKLSEIVSDDEDESGDKDKMNKESDSTQQSVTNTSDGKLSSPNLQENKIETELPILDPVSEDKPDTVEKSVSEDKPDTVERSVSEDKPDTVEKSSTETKTSAIPTLEPDSGSNCLQIENTTDNLQIEEPPEVSNVRRKGVKGKCRRKGIKKGPTKNTKPVTKSIVPTKPKEKKISRELLKLQADIKEMFIKEDILAGTSGIRSCRLARYMDENSQSSKDEEQKTDIEPVVRVEKFKNSNNADQSVLTKKVTKKSNMKTKTLDSNASITPNFDPYLFETDSSESFNLEKRANSASEYDSDSATSSKSESTEPISDIKKKPRRKRRSWQAGVIVPKNRKKKNQTPLPKPTNTSIDSMSENKIIIDSNCFTDKSYCFVKNTLIYDCRLCDYNGSNIVNHYKKQHPHVEIPLSRMSQDIAQEAIKQCDKVNLQSISKLPSERYTCRFCFKQFANQNNLLESFFWHIVSDHTGEYKITCPVCVNDAQCPFDLDIPPPPIAITGQIIGYICGICNYTQVSYENLKNHVVTRHNDKQTEVFLINMSHMSTKAINILLKRFQSLSNTKDSEDRRVLRRTRSNISAGSRDRIEFGDESDTSASACSLQDIVKEQETQPLRIHSKIAFENDSDAEKSSLLPESHIADVKLEPQSYDEENELKAEINSEVNAEIVVSSTVDNILSSVETESKADIFELPHFKVNFTDAGLKEYICCINNNNHYKSTLLISFKKHVQMKHSEKWDGYCCLCKVIVTPQGMHSFFTCLQHFLDKHFDNFPVLEKVVEPTLTALPDEITNESETRSSPKPFLSVRPLSELISTTAERALPSNPSPLPIIESVVSLGTPEPRAVVYPSTEEVQPDHKEYLYEEAQAEIMSQKNSIVLDAMMKHEKLVNVFKCAGRFCSFTTDSAHDALLHASTHSRVGGENALKCAYCDFDSLDNAIDLITHVFKIHGCCQYACGVCFYRAAASQLVNAHIARMHPDKPTTILKAPFVTEESCESTILSRTDAVPYYICNHEDENGEACKFKTYIVRKFCEHLNIKHSCVTEHNCFICHDVFTKDAYVVNHLKTHGLKLYQCVWCVFGAENENELLAHASSKHPSKQPQAYLRVITNKEGTSEFRVLPLAHLNKSNIPYIDIVTSVKENPVREAERSVDLEKLIGITTPFVDSIATTPITTKSSTDQSTLMNPPPVPPSELEPRPATPVAPIIPEEQTTPVIKPDPVEISPSQPLLNTSDIISLDSDDEDVITSGDLGQETPSTSSTETIEPIKKHKDFVYMCSKCHIILKNKNTFKNHLGSCFRFNTYEIPCAYCSFKGTKQKILAHYTKVHALMCRCVKCPEMFSSSSQAKEHESLKNVSGQRISVEQPDKPVVRRKRSLGSNGKTGEPPAKVKKYGPLDVEQLPINPIFDNSLSCALCEFSTKVRLNMVRHLQLHASQQPAPHTAPVNPVPHLHTNEKHFDKMVNLASSSLSVRALDKAKGDSPTVTVLVPPDAAARFPKYVPDRQRLTCGAKGCSYISVDENMLKYHWETLHSGSNDFHCVHCPSYQTLDTSVALTASRIIAHLKMHDVRLYTCSLCSYYHFRRQVVEKHLNEVHKGGNVLIVREEITSPQPPVAPVPTAPTMDLKPWQCGLCEFKSLLRPEVVDHCSTAHQSKMQFKCAYCAFKSSNSENVTKHQSLSHQGKAEDLFYYFYREGSLPNQDGIPFWKAQINKFNIPETRVKTEVLEGTPAKVETPASKSSTPNVDLNIVKQEVPETMEDTIEELCKRFGEFCEPNGLKYKCSLCKNVIEDTKEAMQSHLYEELQYRKWGCSICFYKAFHKRGLNEHMQSEHRQNRDPVELTVDARVETWVAKLLEYQESIIEKSKEKLAQQKLEIIRQPPSTTQAAPPQPTPRPVVQKTTEDKAKPSPEELEKQFGPLGSPVNMFYRCPKCNELDKDESSMRDHLESELNKIRWCCSVCPQTFQTYHQSQFHCKTHSGMSARPVEAPRDSALRSAWVNAVLESQRTSIKRDSKSADTSDSAPEPDNSLLVVRFEKEVPTPEVAPDRDGSANSEDERLVIDEPTTTRKRKCPEYPNGCPHCNYTTANPSFLLPHILRHYGLGPKTCAYCKMTGSYKTMVNHLKGVHADRPLKVLVTEVPTEDPAAWLLKKGPADAARLICLTCQVALDAEFVESHMHNGVRPEFCNSGELVIKCLKCSAMFKKLTEFHGHDNAHHAGSGEYVLHKLVYLNNHSLKFNCSYCPLRFNLKKEWQAHTMSMHSRPEPAADRPQEVIVLEDEDAQTAPPNRKVARKSTTKLPHSRTVAKKSTTKPPYRPEYSFYGTKPRLENLENITTWMPIYNKLVEFPYMKLQETFNINPTVSVEKIYLDDVSE